MESTIFFTTQNKNQYLYDSNNSMFLLSNLLIKNFSENDELLNDSYLSDFLIKEIKKEYATYSKEDIVYYYRKFLFLKKNKFFSEIKTKQRINNTLESDIIYGCVANIKQIVFEVTEVCNLNCKYCTYNELFLEHDKRVNKFLSTKSAVVLFKYLSKIWQTSANVSQNQKVIISFYGGEPLLNLTFIKEIVEYVHDNPILKKRFTFSITTNGILLKKHINYFVKQNFKITVSLDGNFDNNQYRVNHTGENPHGAILNDLLHIMKKYPQFYNNNINYNTVFHDKNSIDSIFEFFTKKLKKSTNLMEVNSDGAKKERIIEISKMQNSIEKSYNAAISKTAIENSDDWSMDSDIQALTLLRGYWANYLRTYNDIFIDKNDQKRPITGTCTPFWKKMFITAKGLILPCERIDYKYSFGEISNGKVNLNYNSIAKTYNNYYNNISKQCNVCYASRSCTQCMFYIDDIENKPNCDEFHTKKEFEQYLSYMFSKIERNPTKIFNLLNSTIYE